MYHKHILIFFLIFLFSCTKTDKVSEEINKIADDLYAVMLDDRIDLKMKFGLPVTEFPDMDFQTAQMRVERSKTFIQRIDKVDREDINHSDDLTLSMMRQYLQTIVDGLPHYWNGFSITPYKFGWQGRNSARTACCASGSGGRPPCIW
jgi:hypothetical protein